MNQIVNFFIQNQALIKLIVAILIIIVVHFNAAKVFVGRKVKKAMFGVEKQAEQLLLNTGQEKMQAVEGMVYNKLPGWVRAVVSLNRFRNIAQKFFDEAKYFVKKNTNIPAQPQSPEVKKQTNQSQATQNSGVPFSATSEAKKQ